MVYGLGLILLLIILGGTIAYVGDKLGMKVGKKRLSLGGLRPRYTSMLITVSTGILIALLSLGLLLSVSQRFRQVVFNLQSLLAELEVLESEVAAKNHRLAELEIEVAELTRQRSDLNRQIGNLSHNLGLLGTSYFQTLSGELVYHQGEVIAERVVGPAKPASQLKKELEDWLAGLDLDPRVAGRDYSPVRLEQLLASVGQSKRRVIRLVAAKNIFSGDQLRLRFDSYRDYPVYQPEEEVLAWRVEDLTFSAIVTGLEQKLTTISREDGLLLSQDRPIDLELKQLYYLLERLEPAANNLKITVVAGQTVWRSDSLVDKLEFSLSY